MKILLRDIVIIDPGHPLHEERGDLRIENGQITDFGKKLPTKNADIWEGEGLHVSPGWVDIGAHSMDPGFEHREDLTSLCKAGAAGGYTTLAIFPNTDPFIHGKAEVLYVQQHNNQQVVQILPIGAVSRNGGGEDIAEIYDMHESGAIAFSDGSAPVQKAGLLLRALQYVKAIQGVVLDQPLDLSLASKGQVHEGPVSTGLGLRGIPSLAESAQVYRNIQLLRYADSRLILHAVSAAESLPVIRLARNEGLQLGTTVAVLNLCYTDESLADYHTHFKVMPPLREALDRDALRKGLKEGVLDAIISNHVPLEGDQKEVEFPYAAFGASGLETTFALCHAHLVPKVLSLSSLIDKLSHGPRRLLGMEPVAISPGAPADLTLFQPEMKWTFSVDRQQSKGKNNPADGAELKGRVFGVIRGRHAYLHKG